MFAIPRRFFTTAAVEEVGKATTEVTAKLQKEFSEQCAQIMKTRGHKKLTMNTVVSKNGHEMKFDFSYGWLARYYCKCDLTTEKMTADAMLAFEKQCKLAGVVPRHCIYFSKGTYEPNPADFKALFVDAKQLAKWQSEKSERFTREAKVTFFCILAMSYLSWTFFSEKNPQRRRLIERWHRYVLKDEVKPDEVAIPVTADVTQPVMKETMEAESVEPIESVESVESVEPVKPVESIVEEIKDETEMNEVDNSEIVEETTSQNEGILSYISDTFWWLLGYKN